MNSPFETKAKASSSLGVDAKKGYNQNCKRFGDVKQQQFVSRNAWNQTSFCTPPRHYKERNLRKQHVVTPTPGTPLSELSTNLNSRASSTPSSDRFIPNRADLRVNLCRASVLSADKARMDILNSNKCHNENGDSNMGTPQSRRRSGSNGRNGSPNSREVLSPIHSEFRRRMRGALLSLPLEERNGSRRERLRRSASDNTSRRGGSGTEESTDTTDNELYNEADLITGTNLSNDPEYHPDPTVDSSDAAEDLGPGSGLKNVLNFSAPPSPRRHSGAKYSFTSHTKTLKRRTSSFSPEFASDPFSHDQLRVLHRSASDRAVGRISGLDPLFYDNSGLSSVAKKVGRRIPTAPSRILDAPELVDDYYLNLVSWGSNNILAVALGQCVYLWDANTGKIEHLLSLSDTEDFVTSVSWSTSPGTSHYIAVGTNAAPIQIWDCESLKLVRTLDGHSARVGALAWNNNWLSSGGRDSVIIQHDVRSAHHHCASYCAHTQEVCGLKWSHDGTTLASGGNENYLCLWDAAMSRRNSGLSPSEVAPRLTLTSHQAAVKALAWCPFHRGLIASGGGTADRTIKFWNSNSGAMLNSVDTGSQVCSLLWSKHNKELCSSHGFSENQLILWRYPSMTKIQEFTGHTARVLHMDQSPDGGCVVSAAADETLRFWDVFGAQPNKRKAQSLSMESICNVRVPVIR